MGCFSTQFVWAVLVHSLYGMIECTVSMGFFNAEFEWAIAVNSLYMG